MKNAYFSLPWLVLVLVLAAGPAHAQPAWRPFRPGLIYAFTTPASPNFPTGSYLLRLDSAYTTASGDSAWTFNRVLRPVDGSTLNGYAHGGSRKSRNNLFGARLVWQAGTGEFVLENVAEGSYQAALSLRLRPRAAVGSTWVACTAPALTGTLTSRTWQPVTSFAGSPSDSVATITLSSGAVVRLSRQYGLLEGPRWLVVSGPAAPQWVADRLPTTLASSPLHPATLFNMQPGDLLGYVNAPVGLGGPSCQDRYILRAIQSRQVAADSLVYTYREQVRTQTKYLGCGSAVGSVISPVRTGRVAFSLRTGQSPQYPALPLLSGEYKNLTNSAQNQILVVGLGMNPTVGGGRCQTGNTLLTFQYRYPGIVGGQTLYGTITDGNWQQRFGIELGLGDSETYETALAYYRRTSSNGEIITCGQASPFVNLLPTRAAQAAAFASLHPNPAAGAAMLTLTVPARSGTRVALQDALGRQVWAAAVPAGHGTMLVPLAAPPPGLYWLQLQIPGLAPITLRLTKE
ncbi:hypothetical protein [Hymenobacter sp.]|uniref:hypothetical protein n=1 Tax=Hymenobacter sp. TaxID=1898978 RepID=UPI00286B084D|nr:hypothetical protein [Hymenobacter sp.]